MAVEFWTRRQPVTSYPSKGKGRNNPFSFENFKTFVGGLSLTVAFAFGTRVVAVNGVYVPAIEFAALGKRICDMLFHGTGEQVIERSDVLKTSPAFERLEKMARFDVGHILVGVVLEEFLPGDRTAQATQHAELATVEIGDSGAVVLTLRLRVKVGNVGEENAG